MSDSQNSLVERCAKGKVELEESEKKMRELEGLKEKLLEEGGEGVYVEFSFLRDLIMIFCIIASDIYAMSL